MTKSNEPTFKQASMELEKITKSLERGELDLDEALKQFEHGLKLSKFLKSRLAAVENKVQELRAKEKAA